MTDRTVRPGIPLFVAVQTPAHAQRSLLPYFAHGLDRTVALLTLEARLDVTHVRKVYVVRKVIDADPGYGPLLLPIGRQLLHPRPVGPDQRDASRQMAAGTDLNRGNSCVNGTIC